MAASREEQGRTDMTPERWQQVCDLLRKALELAPQQRSALLDRACGADPSLRQEVDDLLASSDHVRSSFLQGPPFSVLIPDTAVIRELSGIRNAVPWFSYRL